MERNQTGKGKKIDISMAQAAVSWLHTFLPMLDMGSPPSELKRSGNEHRQFIPVNAYRTKDGYIYLAIGSDAQWKRLVSQPMFAPWINRSTQLTKAAAKIRPTSIKQLKLSPASILQLQ